MIARKDGDQVRLWTRPGTDSSTRFTRIREAVAARRAGGARWRGRRASADATSDFFALRSSQGQATAVLVAFDLLVIDEDELRREPLDRRREQLRKLLKRSTGEEPAPGIQLSEPVLGPPEAIFSHACQMGLEGIVSKRIDSGYVSGRTSNWLKTRNPTFERR